MSGADDEMKAPAGQGSEPSASAAAAPALESKTTGADEETGLLSKVDADTELFVTENQVFGQFRDGLCDCWIPKNCWPSSLFGVCCGYCFVAQLYQREIGAKGFLGKMGSCINITLFFLIWGLVGGLIAAVSSSDPKQQQQVQTFFFNIENILLIFLILLIRQQVRRRYGIENRKDIPCTSIITDEQTQGLAEDCICAWCCGICTITQIARHVYDYENTNKVCRFTATGDATGMAPPGTVQVAIPENVKAYREKYKYQEAVPF